MVKVYGDKEKTSSNRTFMELKFPFLPGKNETAAKF